MTGTWTSSEQLLSQDAVTLGQLVLSMDSPSQDFHIPRLPRIAPDDSLVFLQHESFRDTLERTKGSSFNIFLSNVFSTKFNKSIGTTTAIEAAVCKTYQLKNSGDYFSKVCRSNSAREWLERAIKRRKDVFLVVGIRTVTDAQITQSRSFSRTLSGKFDIPVTQAVTMAAGGGAVALVPSAVVAGNVGVGGSRLNQFNTTGGFTLQSEQIYAVQFRKIELSWFSGRNLDKASLEDGNRWKVYLARRGGGDRQDNIICARVQDYSAPFSSESVCESFFFDDRGEEMVILN